MDKKLIVHGTLIDGNGGTPLEDSAILIFGERIEKVCAFSEMENIEDAEIIDASGKYIIPNIVTKTTSIAQPIPQIIGSHVFLNLLSSSKS